MEKKRTLVEVEYSSEIEEEQERARETALERSRASYNSATIAAFHKVGSDLGRVRDER